MNLTSDELLYLEAKDAYYNEQPIMTDAEFDALEEKLRKNNSTVVDIVGSWDRKAKIKHPTPMRSLEKIQADKKTGAAPIEEFKKWMTSAINKCGDYYAAVEVEQKLDGNAVNLVYENGTLKHALSRGDGEYGRDYLPKIDLSQIPTKIPDKNHILEIRCEAVIDKHVFAEKYAELFSNERNYVAGVLNSDSPSDIQKSEIDLIPVECRRIVNGEIDYRPIADISGWGFKHYNEIYRTRTYFALTNNGFDKLFTELFDKYEKFKREESRYRIDGMVFKINANERKKLGEVEHHPLWAVAVKFKPDDCVTTVKGFEMNMGKTGVFTPVALLDPVDLDGSTVSKASAYNYSFIKTNNLNIGSIVSLVKSGDIIPQIVSVVDHSDEPFDVIKNFKCPYCGSDLEIVNDKHIFCSNENCSGKKIQKFINAISSLKIFGLGESMMETLYNNVSDDAEWYVLTDPEQIRLEFDIAGIKGKVWDNLIDELHKIETLTIEQLIALQSYDGISNDGKTIKEIANKLSGCDYSFFGLEKEVVSGWEEGEEKYNAVMGLAREIETLTDKKVLFHKKSDAIKLKLTLTGSPKEFGYKTKNDYKEYLKSLGFDVDEVAVTECDYLITDDLSSESSKMVKAKKLGKIIKTYGDNIV